MYPARRYLTDAEVRMCNLSLTDEVRAFQEPFLRVFEYTGTTVMTRRENGTLDCDWLSFSSCYSVFFLASHFFSIYIATVERQDVMRRLPDRSFDEDLFLYSLYIFFLFTGLALTSIVESKKVTSYYNLLAVFQLRYYHVKGRRLDLKLPRISRYFSLLFGVVLLTLFLMTNFIIVSWIYKKLGGNFVKPLVENLIACTFVFLDILSLHLMLLTNLLLLNRIASILVDEIGEAFRTGRDETTENYEKLWVDFIYVTVKFGNSFTYSLGYFFVVAIFSATFESYLAIREDFTILIVFSGMFAISMMMEPILAGRLYWKLTEDLRNRLVDVRKEVSLRRKKEMDHFFKFMRYCDRSMSLGGFAPLSNRLASSILKSITTYTIILLQFKQVGQSDSAR